MGSFEEPGLPQQEGSEIEAAVDVSIPGLDDIFRPIFIAQDQEIFQLTLADAKRLKSFLNKAIKFVEEFNDRSIQ